MFFELAVWAVCFRTSFCVRIRSTLRRVGLLIWLGYHPKGATTTPQNRCDWLSCTQNEGTKAAHETCDSYAIAVIVLQAHCQKIKVSKTLQRRKWRWWFPAPVTIHASALYAFVIPRNKTDITRTFTFLYKINTWWGSTYWNMRCSRKW